MKNISFIQCNQETLFLQAPCLHLIMLKVYVFHHLWFHTKLSHNITEGLFQPTVLINSTCLQFIVVVLGFNS